MLDSPGTEMCGHVCVDMLCLLGFLCCVDTYKGDVTCAKVSSKHQSRIGRIIRHISNNRQKSASLWVKEEIRWHCHGVAAVQQHVTVSVWPYEPCD